MNAQNDPESQFRVVLLFNKQLNICQPAIYTKISAASRFRSNRLFLTQQIALTRIQTMLIAITICM